jgi:phenylalanyl-tRNA synthetase beta chain
MRYSYNWLKELSGTKKSPEKVVEDLTFHSFEVESLEKIRGDAIIDIKVLPDRAHDAMSHVGVAREIAVLEGKKLDFDGLKLKNVETQHAASKRRAGGASLRIEIKDKKSCPRYIGAVMTNIEVNDSPDWMKKRLEASGIRAINNVVDATNYVMLELGQPLHAFDANKLANKERIKANGSELRIIVRKAKAGEKIELLDGTTKELTVDDLLITDGDNPLAIAGIKGGKLAEIDENTKTIILESANFNAVSIRKTRTRLNLRTDSSDRFEKDIDPNLAEKAMARLVEISEHIANGKLKEISDIYPELVKPWKIKLDSGYVNKLLGEFILVKDMVQILNLLGIKAKEGKIIECVIPTIRIDLKTQEDLIEEIGRIWGYEKVKEQPIISEILPAKINEQIFFERKIQDILTGLGYDEVYNYSFYGEKDTLNCGLDKVKHLELENPMNPDQKFMRASLIPGIIKNVHQNLKHFKSFRIFEEGRIYFPDGNKIAQEKRLSAMALVLNQAQKTETFFHIKGAIEDLLDKLGIKDFSISKIGRDCPKFCQPERSAEIRIGKDRVGLIGEVSPQVLSEYKIKNQVAVAEFDLEMLHKFASVEKIYEPIGKYPTVMRDVSLLAGQDITVSDIMELVKKTGENLVIDVELFDIFEKDGKNSFAFHIKFGLKNRTLESKEVDDAMENIISALENELKVEIRK